MTGRQQRWRGKSHQGSAPLLVGTGETAAGDFRCVDCGYGIVSAGPLPLCPMCGHDGWEAAYLASHGQGIRTTDSHVAAERAR